MSQPFPELLRDRPAAERDLWARWVLGSHSDQFPPEMTDATPSWTSRILWLWATDHRTERSA